MIVLRRFWGGEQGQDLIEYTLLIALVVLGSAALMGTSGKSVSKVWNAANAALTSSATSTTAPTGGGGDPDHDGH